MANYAPSDDVHQQIATTWSNNVTSGPIPVGSEEEMSAAPMTYACRCYDFVIETVLMGALCIFGFAGNSVSTVCLWWDRFKSATPFLLISLSVADTLFLATVFALRVVPSIHTFAWPLSWLPPAVPYLGKYVYPTALVAETGTIYLTILVTVNRYVSVCWPYRAAELCSIRSARLHVAAVSLFAVVFNLPRYFEYKIVRASPEVGDDGVWNSSTVPPSPADNATLVNAVSPEELAPWLGHDPVYRLIYQNLLYFLVLFLFPLILLTFLNQRLIVELRRTRKRRARMRGGGGRRLGGTDSARSEDDMTLKRGRYDLDVDRCRHCFRRNADAGRRDADPPQYARPSPSGLPQSVLVLRAPQRLAGGHQLVRQLRHLLSVQSAIPRHAHEPRLPQADLAERVGGRQQRSVGGPMSQPRPSAADTTPVQR